jgi:hypothetical protein
MAAPLELNTLSETINELKKDGFMEDFIISGNSFIGNSGNKSYKPEELTIMNVCRFEGISDPDDMSVVYILQSNSGTKGIFVDAYGTYALQGSSPDLLSKLKISKDH